jgi:hypothetical protein
MDEWASLGWTKVLFGNKMCHGTSHFSCHSVTPLGTLPYLTSPRQPRKKTRVSHQHDRSPCVSVPYYTTIPVLHLGQYLQRICDRLLGALNAPEYCSLYWHVIRNNSPSASGQSQATSHPYNLRSARSRASRKHGCFDVAFHDVVPYLSVLIRR